MMNDNASPAKESQPIKQKWSPSAVLAIGTQDSKLSSKSSEAISTPLTSSSSSPSTSDREVAKPAGPVRELPGRFFDCEPEELFVLIEDMLVQLMSHNDGIPLHPSDLTRFHSRATPGISIGSYLRRMAKYTTLDKPCMLVILVYIDRVCERLSGFTICSLTVHRFVCSCCVCEQGSMRRIQYKQYVYRLIQAHYARVGGISLAELNLLEKEFLDIIDWRLIVTSTVMQHYYTSLVQMHPNYTLGHVEGPTPTIFTGAPSHPK